MAEGSTKLMGACPTFKISFQMAIPLQFPNNRDIINKNRQCYYLLYPILFIDFYFAATTNVTGCRR